MVERYLAANEPAVLLAFARNDRNAAARLLSTLGTIRMVSSIYLREDNTSLTLFDAPSVEALKEALVKAGIEFHRIGEAVDLDPAHLTADEAC